MNAAVIACTNCKIEPHSVSEVGKSKAESELTSATCSKHYQRDQASKLAHLPYFRQHTKHNALVFDSQNGGTHGIALAVSMKCQHPVSEAGESKAESELTSATCSKHHWGD